jgi:2-hydroxychromene-2-carboxylate isomerase
MTPVVFYFDFGSPNAYLSHRVIPDIESRTGARFDYIPILLGGLFKLTNNQPPMVAFGPVKNKLAYEARETERFVRRHGLVEFTFNPDFPINTLQLMRGAVAAQDLGVFAPYVEAVFRDMWATPKKMDDPEVFRAALAAAALPAKAIVEKSQDQTVKDRLAANTQAAFEHGAFGSPSFLVGDELFFGKDRLRDVEEEIVAQQS